MCDRWSETKWLAFDEAARKREHGRFYRRRSAERKRASDGLVHDSDAYDSEESVAPVKRSVSSVVAVAGKGKKPSSKRRSRSAAATESVAPETAATGRSASARPPVTDVVGPGSSGMLSTAVISPTEMQAQDHELRPAIISLGWDACQYWFGTTHVRG